MQTDRLVRRARRRSAAGALVTLALAAWACSDEQSTPSTPDGSVNADAGQHIDASVSTDGSTADEGSSDSDANLPPDLDAAIDEAAVRDVAGGDADQADIARDAQSEGVGNDSTAPGDATVADALDSAPDGDTSSPDGDATPVPIFSDCAATNGVTLYAIIDATMRQPDPAGGVCSCQFALAVTAHRILCGSLPPENVWFGACPGGINVPMVGERWILLISPPAICSSLGNRAFSAGTAPVSDWDALLAEQIAGHADSGSSDAGTDDDGASDVSNADGSADTSSDATVGN